MVGLSVNQKIKRHNTKTQKYRMKNHLTPNIRITDITRDTVAIEVNTNVRQPFPFPMVAFFAIVIKPDSHYFATSNFTCG